MLGTCESPVMVVKEEGEIAPVPTVEPHEETVYASCEEAA